MATIITKNSATAGNTPSNLTQGELAINVADGRLFYGSGSSSVVKQFDTIPTASYLNTLNQNLTFNGNLTLNGTASISYLNVQYETASVIYSSGSNQFGDAPNDVQSLYGSVIIPTGSLTISGSTVMRSNTLPNTDSVFQVLSGCTTSSFNVINNNSVEIGANRKIIFYPDVSNNSGAFISLANSSKSYELYSSGINSGVFFIYNRTDSKSPIVVTPDKIGLGVNTDFSSATLAGAALIVTASNIGIGTATPTASLHISASNSGSSYSFLVQNSLGQTLFSAQNDRTVNINSTNVANGNTTIGTTNGTITFNQGYNNVLAGNALTFYNGGAASTIQGFYTNPGIAIGYTQTTINPNPNTALSIRGTTTTSGSGVLFVTGSSTTKLLGVASETNANILVVSGSGNVGIGTTTPTYNLEVVGSNTNTARFYGSSGTAVVGIGVNGTLQSSGGQFRLYGNASVPLTLGSYGVWGDLWIINGNVGIGQGTTAPTLSSRFTIKGSGATSATTAFLVQNSTPTTLFQIQDHGGSSFAGNMTVSGSVRISGSAGLTVIGSGSTVLDIQGSQGQLFSITDSLSGSLFSVNDISGLPILEVFSDSTTLIGDYLDPMLITTKKVTTSAVGSFVVYSLPTASYDTAFFDYSIKSGSNARAGQIMAIQSGASVNFTETTTTDFGSTSGVSFTMMVSGSNLMLTGSAATSGWTVKTVIRGI